MPKHGDGQFHSLSIDSELALLGSGEEKVDRSSLRIRSKPMLLSRGIGSQARFIGGNNLLHEQVLGDADVHSWETVTLPGPAIEDKETVVNLAKMCSDAYVEAPSQPSWLNTSLGFNHSDTFGWKTDGLRGHVFTDKTNETVIIAFKGTSIGMRQGPRPVTVF